MRRHLPQIPMPSTSNTPIAQTTLATLSRNIPALCLRLGLAFVFLYAAFFVSSDTRTGGHYVPAFITAHLSVRLFLTGFAVFEVVLALWLLAGKAVRTAGLLAAAVLLSITLLNLADFHIIFRNIAIIAGAIALATLPGTSGPNGTAADD